MSPPVPVLLRFESHDQLVLSYYSTLTKDRIRLKTSKAMTVGTSVEVRLSVVANETTLSLGATVQEAEDVANDKGRYVSWVTFQRENATEEIESFILNTDPSEQLLEPRRKLTVVVIDDTASQRELAAQPFIDRGDAVYLAEDGLEGLGLCLRHNPDVILSDVQMPKVDGWQLLRMLKSRSSLKNTPVILLTTLSNEEDRLRGYRLGVADYLAKPYTSTELVEHAERAIQHARVGGQSWATETTECLRGDLKQVSLPALLAFLEIERKSGTVHLLSKSNFIVLNKGRPVRAKSETKDSLDCQAEALYDLLALQSGHFEFTEGEVDKSDSIHQGTSVALMEFARRCDEAVTG